MSELFKYLGNKIEGKSLLDIGCVGHDIENTEKPTWQFSFFEKRCKEVYGIDLLKKECEILNKKGHKIFFGDAENFNLNKKFEVIFAGEIIEHLSNVGNFLECCKNHLKKEGKLIITTPNSFGIFLSLKRILKHTNDKKENPEHTCLFSPTLVSQLLARHGFEVQEFFYFDSYSKILGKIRYKMIAFLLGKKAKRKMGVVCRLK